MRYGSIALAALTVMLGTVVRADVEQAARDVIGPGYARFAEAAAALDGAAQADCSAAALQAPYQAAWDAWAAIDYFQLGPVEQDGRALAVSFWPDKKSSGQRAQQGLIDANAPVIDDPVAFATISVAARGLSGMERLLYQPGVTGDEEVLCRMRRATAGDLARTAAAIKADWPGFEALLTTAGASGNSRYLTGGEAQQALYTQLITGLEYLAQTRLGRPIGTADKPRPEAAEARAAGRSLRNVTLSLTGLRDLAMALRPEAAEARAAFDKAIGIAENLEDPIFDGVANPDGRKRALELERAILSAKLAVETDIGAPLGLSVGFNSKDGD